MKARQGMRTAAALGVLWAVSQAGAATVRVAGGEWRLLGQVAATQVVVESGAVLGGTGTVHGAAVVRGAVAPGRTAAEVGVLTFAESLAFDGGRFRCDVAASNSLDRLVVTGAVSGAATVLVSQTAGAYPDQVVIVDGAAGSDYSAFSVLPAAGWRLGESGALDLWLGGEPGFSVLGTNGAAIASGEAASREKGTAIGPVVNGTAWTNTLMLTNDGNAVLDITDVRTNGADSLYFTVQGVPASIPIGGAASITVAYTPTGPANHSAALVISNTSPTDPFTIHLAGTCYALSTNNGPYAGGNPVVLTNGHYGIITNVTVGGSAATILDSGANWVAFMVTAVGSAGVKDLLVQTSDNGDHEVPGAYTVNPAGSIASVDPAGGSWTGGYEVVIGGADLGNGGDITNVTLCGVAAAVGTQSATQVVVTAGAAGAVGVGDVRVFSTSHGETLAAGAFEYLREPQAALGFAPASPQAYGTTNGLATTGGSGTGVVSYAVTSGPGAIAGGTNLAVTAGSGAIEVVATKAQDDFYFATAATATVTAVKADQTIAFPAISDQETTNEVGLAATATSGLGVTFAVGAGPGSIAGGTNLTFTGEGSVSVVASQGGDANWNAVPDVTNTFTVTKAVAQVYLDDLAQTYDGSARTVTATTMPAGLTVVFTYDGNMGAPTNAGTYAVTGTVNDALYQGVATGALVVSKADQTIAGFVPTNGSGFVTTDAAGLAATATSGFAVSFAVASGPASIAGGTNLTFSTSGQVSIAASQAGDGNWNPAPDVTHTFTVTKAAAAVYLGDLAQVYDGTARTASATTMPAGLTVVFTYDGNMGAPTNAGTYAVTGTVNDLMYQGNTNGMLTVARAQDTITFGATNQAYDSTGKAVTAVADSGSPVAVTYDGATNLPVNVGVYAVTGIVNAANWEATNTTELTIVKGDQVITHFLPPDGAHFVLGAVTGVSAQASSGLAVGFVNRTPVHASLVGTNLTFTNTGLVRVRAEQAGDANWNAAVPVTNAWRSGGMITNVVPGAANVGGGIDVLIQGQWLGDGADITNVTLAAVQAAIVTQSVDEVTVTAGAAPATVTGDVQVASASGGAMVLSNAFEYLWLDAPVQLDPVNITPSNLVARWELVPAAARHVLDAGTDTNFAAYVSGYEKLDVALAEQYAVEGLADNTWYAIRLFAWNAAGYSWPSRTVWVPTGTNTPYETHPPLAGPVSQGAVMDHALANMFHGAGLGYAAASSDSNVMTVAVGAGGRLVMNPVGPGTAEITVAATDPVTGYTSTYTFTVQVVGAPVLVSAVFLPRELWNPRFTQALEVRNDSGLDAIGLRVLFSGLMPGITVENQTGTAADGRPMIEMQTAFADGATLNLNIVYLCTGAYRADAYPPTVELQYILPGWVPPLPGEGTAIGAGYLLADGRFIIQFDSVAGRLYAIEYRNNFPGGEWVQVPLRLRATANRTQWIDAGPPATQPPEGLRIYRVKEVAE